MKIAIDVRLLGRGGQSGIEEYTRELVSHLIENDRENRYALFYNGISLRPLPSAWRANERITVTNWRMPNRLLDLAARVNLAPALDRRESVDLVFSPHFNLIETAHAPRIITFHDLSFFHHPDFFSRRQRLWHTLQNWKTQAHRAARLVAVSAFTKSDLVEILGIPEEKISVVYSGINPAFTSLPPDNPALIDWRRKHNLEYPYLLSLGTLEPRKNLIAAIRAFNLISTKPSFRNLRLVIAGRPGWLYHDILREAQTSLAHDRIFFLGPVENNERILLYNGAEAFLYPSFFEGFGFPPLEAQACGTPVIASHRTSLPEILGSSALLVDPWRITDLADAIEATLANQNLRAKLITKGKENARRFDWNETARAMMTLFHHAI